MHRTILTVSIAFFAVAIVATLGAADADNGGSSATTLEQTGFSASEVLRGNGSRAGYVLGHGNVIEGSEWVSVGVHRARNIDYTIDYSSGSIFFNEPVPKSESIRVDYRYADSGKNTRALNGPSSMLLRFGSASEANLTYCYRTLEQPGGDAGIDLLTYGVNTTTKIGNSSVLKSLIYVATPEQQDRMSLNILPAAGQANVPAPKRDELMVHSADFGAGKVRLKVDYQDVGESFAGFNALRETGAVEANLLNQLEREKGIRRMGFASDIALANGGLSLARATTSDGKGDILTQSYTYSGPRMKLGFTARSVDKEFSRFKDLKESDRDQIANEAGVKRETYFLQFNMGASTETAGWSGLTHTTLSSKSSNLTYTSASLAVGALNIEADVRKTDSEFVDMRALSDEERTSMVLAAKKQFEPRTTAAAVTAQDKAQVQNEVGLDRESYRAQYNAGPLWLSLAKSAVSDNKGGLRRTDYHIEHNAFKLHLGRHYIDPEFKRLSSLQKTELKYFGNESGMARTEADGEFRLAFGTLQVNHAQVTDQNGAGVRRDSIDFKNSKLSLRANLQDIDPNFSRLMDLSDADKELMLKERGFRKSDYLIELQAARNLKLKSYLYDSTNTAAGQTRDQRKHEFVYARGNSLTLTGLADDFSYVTEDGNISGYSRRKITFDHTFKALTGLLFKGSHDTNISQDENGRAVRTEVAHTHIETNPSNKTSYTFDTLQMELGEGRFEDTWTFGLKTQMSRRLALVASVSRTDRNENPEANTHFGVDWAITNDLKMSATIANRDGGPKGSQQVHKFMMNGIVLKRALGFEDVKVGSAVNTTQLSGRQTACDNALKVEAKFLKGQFLLDNSDKLNPNNGVYYTSRILRYESDKDPKKPYHFTYFRQNLITPTNEFAKKRNYSAEVKLSKGLAVTASSYFGKDGQNGAVLPIGGTVCKLTYSLSDKKSVFADYTADLNETTHRRARTTGLGFTGTLSNNASVEVYWGWSRLVENPQGDSDTVFRLKYDHRMSRDHFITVTAQKRSAVEKSAINPHQGNIIANLEFNTLFH